MQKTELGQYPAILNSRLVTNAYLYKHFDWFLSMIDHVLCPLARYVIPTVLFCTQDKNWESTNCQEDVIAWPDVNCDDTSFH